MCDSGRGSAKEPRRTDSTLPHCAVRTGAANLPACPEAKSTSRIMTLPTTKHRLMIVLGSVLMIGFTGISLLSYLVSARSMRETLVNNELPLTSNNIYSEIQASLLRPIYVSSLMANDTFLKDWMLEGEDDESKVRKYLTEIRDKYGVFSTFVVSDLTRRYYHFNGPLKDVSADIAKDRWFFSMADHPRDYRVDVDTNEAAGHELTIFVNHKIHGYDGRFIGVTGLGLRATTVASLIQRYQERYHRDIYFVDRQGWVKSHSDRGKIDRVDIHAVPGLDSVADTVVNGEAGSLNYQRDGDRVFLRYRYIPELDWVLLVEQPEKDALEPIRTALHINLAIGFAVTILVLIISGVTVHHFHRRLESLARTDKLTGLYNRQFFDALFDNTLRKARRHNEKPSLILFDLDNLKEINDRYGHLSGDRVIRDVARLARQHRREVDLVGRWGGDEFIVLLDDCDEAAALRIAEHLRERIRNQVRDDGDRPVTLSMGIAGYRPGDDRDSLLERADTALYRAKRQGRDRSVVYSMDAVELASA